MIPIQTLMAIAALKPDKKPGKPASDPIAEFQDSP